MKSALPGSRLSGRRRAVIATGLVALSLAGCGGSKAPRRESAAPRLGSWAPAGKLITARGAQTESTLRDGTVLVVGGQQVEVNSALISAELFDPATGKWKATASLGAARLSHTATVLSDGRVLVTGGLVNRGGALNTAELFDPAAGTWSPAGTMATARFNHTATLLSDGQVIVAGGFNVVDSPGLVSAELYDPAANAWKATAAMKGGRGIHTATLLSTGKVLVAAGNEIGAFRRTPEDVTSTTVASGLSSNSSNGEGEVATAELYDPATGSWSSTANLAKGRSLHTATTLKDGKVLVAGGFSPDGELDSAELYDPAAATWSLTGPLPSPRTIHTASLLPDGQVLVAGGQVGTSGTILSPALRAATLYDPTTSKWKQATGMGTPRTGHSATVLASGQVLVVGGLNPNGPVPNTELFSLKAKAGL